jgi:hypothetical protein
MSKPELPTQYELPEDTSACNPLVLFTPVAVALAQNEHVQGITPVSESFSRLSNAIGTDALPLALLVRTDHPREVSCRAQPLPRASLRPGSMIGNSERIAVAPQLDRIVDLVGSRIIDITVSLGQWREPSLDGQYGTPLHDDLGFTTAYLREAFDSATAQNLRSRIPPLFTVTRGEISL